MKWLGSPLNPDIIVDKQQQWKFQWNRLQRWFLHIKDIEQRSEFKEITEHDIDIFITFFQNCYHLRDWFLVSRPELKEEINQLFKKNFEMKFCRDICNAFKHKKLSHYSVYEDFDLYKEYDYFKAQASPNINPVLYNIAVWNGSERIKYNIFDLIQKCYNLWEVFIKTNT